MSRTAGVWGPSRPPAARGLFCRQGGGYEDDAEQAVEAERPNQMWSNYLGIRRQHRFYTSGGGTQNSIIDPARTRRGPMKVKRVVTLVVLVLLMVGCENVSGPESASGANEETGTIAAEILESIARRIYDDVERGEQESSFFGFVEALDLYPGPVNLAGVITLVGQGEPFILGEQIAAMSKGFEEGILVCVESFVESMREWGVFERSTMNLITKNSFDQAFAGLLAKSQYLESEVMPAFILHLGRERAKRSAGYRYDHIWSDGHLDPLQFLLLSYSLLLSGEQFSAATVSSDQDWNTMSIPSDADWADFVQGKIKGGLRNFIRDKISEIFGIPLERSDAIKAAIAASVVLYSYSFEMEAHSGNALNMRYPENPDASSPHETLLTATLNFNFTPRNEFSRVVVEYCYGDPIPDNGPVSLKPIEWSTEGELDSYGTLRVHSNMTGPAGTVTSTYSANDEKVPKDLRIAELRGAANGTVEARASELLPHKWRGLAAIAREVKDIGLAATRLTVSYHEFPDMQVSFDTRVNWSMQGWPIESRFISTMPVYLDTTETVYMGEGSLYYHSLDYDLETDCEHSMTESDGDFFVVVHVDGEDVLVHVNSEDPPKERLQINCENFPPVNVLLSQGWAGWVVANGGSLIQGPWEKGSQFVLLRTEYTTSKPDLQVSATTKVELRRR